MLRHDFPFDTFDVHLHDLPYLAKLYLFLVTRAAWERFEFLIKRVGDSRSFPFLSSVFNYALLVTCVLALTGLILYTLAACKYKYRERDDRPYDQRFVVDVYSRYLDHPRGSNVSN